MKFDFNNPDTSIKLRNLVNYFEGKAVVKKTNAHNYARAIRLEEAMSVIYSKENIYDKVYKLGQIYESAIEILIEFKDLEKYKDDERIMPIRDRVRWVASIYRGIENRHLFDAVNYYHDNKEFFEDYSCASYFVKSYVKDVDSYNTKKFLDKAGLNKLEFDRFLKVVDELDADLYSEYLKKADENSLVRKSIVIEKINNLKEGITTGYNKDGEEFDAIDVLKNVPFYEIDQANEIIKDFELKNASTIDMKMKKVLEAVCPEEKDLIWKTLVKYKLNNGGSSLNENETLNTNFIDGNGRELTMDDKHNILNFIKDNELPELWQSFIIVKQKYLEGTLKKNKTLKKDI